jgi:predicted GH43/DUF377 family glycosyl hydrolase
MVEVTGLGGPWEVSFDTNWGGPATVEFQKLEDWSLRPEEGIRFYSGTAIYRKTFDLRKATAELFVSRPGNEDFRFYLDLGVVKNLARVSLNGRDIGVVWCPPWRLDITDVVKPKDNRLEISVANLWPNRLIGDERLPPDAEYGKDGNLEHWPDWFLKKAPRPATNRLTFTTWKHFTGNSPLLPSGLLGPVSIQVRRSGYRFSHVARQEAGKRVVPIQNPDRYPDGRPNAKFRIDAQDRGIVLRHGNGPNRCDDLGARDVWVWESAGHYYMHYDGAGPKGWLTCLATSPDLKTWTPKGPVFDFGESGAKDSASASYGVTYDGGRKWHMFYLGTPHSSPPPELVPSFPYLTMKAEGPSPTGPWRKRYDITPFSPKPGTYYSATASPGQVIRYRGEYLMFFSASTDGPIKRTLGIARTKDLDGPWTVDPEPILPPAEQVENTSLYYEESSRTWFLLTNHVGLKDGLEYTDAVWVYWTKDLESWDPGRKAIVLDGVNCGWSKEIIGLPSAVRVKHRLALFYDGYAGPGLPAGVKSHMGRDVGLAWLDLPVILPYASENR